MFLTSYIRSVYFLRTISILLFKEECFYLKLFVEGLY